MPWLLAKLSRYFVIILGIPTFLILISWNALPGSNLYSLKRFMEKGPELAFGQTSMGANYGVYLADRRFSEAETLIQSDNTAGLTELNSSIVEAKVKTMQAGDEQTKQQLVNNLIAYNQKLEAQKQVIASANPAPTTVVYNVYNVYNSQPGTNSQTTANPATPTTTGQPSTAARPSGTATTPTAAPTGTAGTTASPSTPTTAAAADTTVQAINQTQQQIQQTINELEGKDHQDQQNQNRDNRDQKDKRDSNDKRRGN